jgi:hypothetical protein
VLTNKEAGIKHIMNLPIFKGQDVQKGTFDPKNYILTLEDGTDR